MPLVRYARPRVPALPHGTSSTGHDARYRTRAPLRRNRDCISSRHHPEEPLLRRHLGRPTFLKIARSLKSGPLGLGMREDTGTATTPILRNYGYRAATDE